MAKYASDIYNGHFAGQKVVIFGGAQGIGQVMAGAFAEAGATVLISDLSPKVADTAEAFRAEGFDVDSAVVDVTDDEEVANLFADLEQKWGSLNVLVNNAGIIEINELENTKTAGFRKVVDVNTTAQFIASREALPLLRAAAGGASIINAASGQARKGFIYTPAYAASKHGVVGLTQSLAIELGPDNIRVNCYCPGIVATDMWSYNDSEWGKRLGSSNPGDGELMRKWAEDTPLARMSTPQEIANAVLFLASDAAECITGQAINIDGGMFMN